MSDPRLVQRIAAVFPYVVKEAKPSYLSDTVQTMVAAGDFDRAAVYIAQEVLAYIGPMIAAGRVEHGPKGECSEPELCMVLIEGGAAAVTAYLASPETERALAEAHWAVHSNAVLRELHPGGELRQRSDEQVRAILAALREPK